MADAKQNGSAWREAKREILLALNLPAEYESLGLHLASQQKPNAKGWIAAHAFQSDDRTPSAGINVQDGPLLGYYHDFRDATKNCGFFDFCIRAKGGQYPEVLKHFAAQAKVKLPSGDEERTVDKLEFRLGSYQQATLSFGERQQYAAGKPGVSVRAIDDIGCRAAAWPKGLSAERQNQLLVVPMYGSSILMEHEPTGWHCAAVHPARKIRQFQGNGNEDRLLKTMTLGEYGLMNVDGLARLADAEVVNIVEGLTDLLATQAALVAAREIDAKYEKHVVLSTGGAQCGPKPEWLQHFAGKDVRVWGDVGDKDNAGQIGAMRWTTALHPVAKAARNVVLPLGKEGGKNDVRAWLTDPESPRGYVQMDEYAGTFAPIEATDAAAQMSPHDAILKNLGLIVLGEYERSQRIEVYCEHTQKSGTLHDIDKLTVAKLTQIIGPEPVEEYVHDGQEPQPGKYQIKDVRKAIAAAASGKLYFGEQRHGAGVWLIEGQLYLVKSRQVGIVGPGKVEPSTMPFVAGHILDITQSSGDWFSCEALSRYLIEAQRDAWCQQVFEEADRLFAKWYWRQRSAPRIATALVIASWLQTTWEWRPQVFLTGESNTGKSMLVGETISPMFGSLGLYCQKPSAAGISQTMHHHGRVLFVDEFEEDRHRQQIFEMFRSSSQRSGGRKLRGSASHEAVSFVMQHIPWFAAINMGVRKQPDRNRFIVLDLDEFPAGAHGKIQLPTLGRLRDLGQRLLAIGLTKRSSIVPIATHLKTLEIEKVPGRVVENFSLPAAVFAAVFGLDKAMAEATLRDWMTQWDFIGQSVRDHVEVLQEILTSEVVMEGGRRTNVSALLRELPMPDVTATLARLGIRRIHKRGGEYESTLFFCTSVLQRNLLRPGGDFQGHAIDQYLLRFKGARRSQQRLGGDERFAGVEVPDDTIRKSFHECEDEENDKGGDIEQDRGF